MSSSSDAADLVSRAMAFVALAALALGAVRRVGATRRRHAQQISRRVPERLQVWEDEGGQNQMASLPR